MIEPHRFVQCAICKDKRTNQGRIVGRAEAIRLVDDRGAESYLCSLCFHMDIGELFIATEVENRGWRIRD